MAAATLDRDGAALVAGAAVPVLPALLALADTLPADRAGVRLHGLPALPHLLALGMPQVDYAALPLPGGLEWLGV